MKKIIKKILQSTIDIIQYKQSIDCLSNDMDYLLKNSSRSVYLGVIDNFDRIEANLRLIIKNNIALIHQAIVEKIDVKGSDISIF